MIEVKIKDKAGNTNDYSFRFLVEFVPPAPSMVLKSINPFAVDFAQRGKLQNAVLAVSEATLTNLSSEAMLFSLEGASTHSVKLLFEEAIRIHQAFDVSAEEWRAKYRFAVTNPQITVSPQRVDLGSSVLWENIRQLRYTSTTSSITQVISPPSPTTGATFALTSDQLPLTIADPWVSFHPPFSDLSGGNYFGTGPCCYYISYYAYRSDVGTFLNRRNIQRFQSVSGHPFNQLGTQEERGGFSDGTFEVLNQFGRPTFSISGWFRLPPHETYTITKLIKTPSMPQYNDTEVGNIALFSSYTLKQYDKSIAWEIDESIEIKVVHDVAFDKADKMFALNLKRGTSAMNYTLSR